MTERDRTVVFGTTDLREEFPLFYSTFEETLPEPKVNKVSIPAGADIDITEALGPVAFSNGRHVFKFLMYADDIETELRRFTSLVHGKRTEYALSWDEGYVFTGRWKVSEVEHLTEKSVLLTIEVDRYPWKVSESEETVDLNAHPTASYTLEGSERYSNVTITMGQPGTVTIGAESLEVDEGTTQLAAQVLGDTEITVTVGDWVYYIDGTDLIVNPDYYTQSGTNVAFDSEIFTLVGTDLQAESEADQHATLKFTRKDL